MLQNIKHRFHFISNPKDIYEANYLLLLILKHLFYFPFSIKLDNNGCVLRADFNRFFIPLCIIMLVLWQVAEDIWNYAYQNEISKIFNVVFCISVLQMFSIISSILVCYLLTFLKTKKFIKIFASLKSFDDMEYNYRIKRSYKKISFYNLCIFIFFISF